MADLRVGRPEWPYSAQIAIDSVCLVSWRRAFSTTDFIFRILPRLQGEEQSFRSCESAFERSIVGVPDASGEETIARG
jgi:hypothetical protein